MFLLAQSSHAHDSSPHVTNWVGLLAKMLGHSPAADFLIRWEKVIFMLIVAGLLTWLSVTISKNIRRVPGRLQVAAEYVVTALDNLVCGVLGPGGRRYTPFIGTLFIYILFSNLFGLLPLQNSATAYLTTTAPMAVCVFLCVQWVGITKNGLKGYVYHMAGSPKEIFGYILVPLNLPLHILGEFIKPISLAFRLFGNVMAGHILVAVFLGLGVGMLSKLHVPAGVPLHFPFLFLEILVGTIQAFVFALLSTVYIGMMLPHEEEHHSTA